MVASHLGNKDLVRWFLINKADANARTHLGWRAIHFAAKRGHVATIDMLCSSGAVVDPVTSGLLHLYIHRGLLPAEVLSRTRSTLDSPLNKSRPAPQIDCTSLSTDLPNETNGSDKIIGLTYLDFSVAVNDSQIIINQLQCQSTSYDLELARRKRELIRRLPPINTLPQQSAVLLVQQTQRLARADLPAFERLQAVRKVFAVLPLKSLGGPSDEGIHVTFGTAVEPYLRLFEACMCESHCPSSLAAELSVLSVYFVALGSGRNGELNVPNPTDDGPNGGSPRASFIASYVARLLRKLISKNNPQYRAGILAHLCRILSFSNEKKDCNKCQRPTDFWSDLNQFTVVLSSLVRLGETLDQPLNVARLAALIGLIGRRMSELSLPSVVSSSTSLFSDLADILVGWGVDPTSVTRGINLDSIYTELRFGLSSWWLHLPNKNSRSVVSGSDSNEDIPTINPSMHEMINRQDPVSKAVLRTLCLLAEKEELRDPLCQLVLLDLRLAFRFLKAPGTNEVPNTDDLSKCEELGLFSLALFSAIVRHTTSSVDRLALRRHILGTFSQDCALKWLDIPPRLRMALVAVLNDDNFLTSLPPTELMQLISTVLCVKSNSPFEYNQACMFALTGLKNTNLTSNDRCQILTYICKLAGRILSSRQSLHTCSMDPFILCIRIVISNAFSDGLEQNERLRQLLFRLSEFALCSNFPERQEVCSDLLLALGVSQGRRKYTSTPNLGLAWYTTRRPDKSATALVMPPAASQVSSSCAVVGSASAYPSLPAVAGVLGFLTRGAPYNATASSSRLCILKEPSDWIRRLYHLICPIPAEMNSKLFVVSAEETVLWYAAWTMIDYKLKVAPWVNPLKTFLSLEGTMRAFLRPNITPETKSRNPSNSSGVLNFHIASSDALSHQPWIRQLRQTQSLMTFLGFLERLIDNATKGFAVSLPRPVLPACTFFAANEATCSQWFGRVRTLLLRIADGWPLPPVANGCFAGDVPATVLYHAYTPLVTIMQSDPSDLELWLSGLPYNGVSCDVLIRVAKALHRLSAWEELHALSEWTTRLFDSTVDKCNPFAWIEGLALLTRGQWDGAVKIFRSFFDFYVQQKRRPWDMDSSETTWTLGFAYTTELLFQCYLNEGDNQAAFSLRDVVHSLSFSQDTDESGLTSAAISSLKLNCMRLSYVEKLSNWSSSTTASSKNEHTGDEGIKWWSHEKLTTKLCQYLTDAALTLKSSMDGTSGVKRNVLENLSKLITDVRLASLSTLMSSSKPLACLPELQCGLTSEGSLCTWLTRANLLLNPPSQCIHDSDLVHCHSNTIGESSWRHLLGHPDSHNARLNSGLQGCRWACENQNYLLARRLLVRELKALSFIDGMHFTAVDHSLETLYNIIRSVKFTGDDHLSQIQRLLFYDCLAQLLWSTDKVSPSFDPKLAAIDTLSHGLRTIILEESTSDPVHHAARCHTTTQVALRLFGWLEASQRLSNRTWAEWISREQMNSRHETCLPPNLQSSGQSSSHIMHDNHSVWLSRLLMMATRLAPTGSSSAAWLRMASWCYTRGQTMVEQTRVMAVNMLLKPGNWTDPQTAIESTACPVLQANDYRLVSTALKQHGLQDTITSVDESRTQAEAVVPMLIASLLTFLTPDQSRSLSKNAVVSDEATDYKAHGGLLPNLRLTKLCPDDETDPLICKLLSQHLHQTLPQLFPPSSPIPVDLLESLHHLTIELTQRQYTLHTSAAQAYATYLTVAGQRAAPEVVRMEEPITRLDTMTGRLLFYFFSNASSYWHRNLFKSVCNE
ncbi:unnamed protein product [Echinostoma caproni]|uniref:ANK_REP_REGION domain-containing protein n=1 Tax=Echinostoma caproni TaxID=27848 RepID=A0A183AWC7_9TREM|nr:unnamed protein product [Echinostoma caproni]